MGTAGSIAIGLFSVVVAFRDPTKATNTDTVVRFANVHTADILVSGVEVFPAGAI